EYEGYNASYSTDLSDDEIATAAGTTIDKVKGPERVGAVGETSGTVTITNTYNYSNITLSLFKYLDHKDPGSVLFTFTVSALKNDYTLVELSDSVTNVGSSISYTTAIESDYVITKSSNNEQNVYFLIKENDPSSNQYTKDDSYIIAKVKKLGKEDQYVVYYRVSDSKEKENIDSDPSKIIGYANTAHSISDSSEVAFYNESYSLTIKKEWLYSEGTKVPKDIYDTYTAVNLIVWRTYNGGTPEKYATVTLSSSNNWEYTLNDVPRFRDTQQKSQYIYYIQEMDQAGNVIENSGNVLYYKIVDDTASTPTNVYSDAAIIARDDTGSLVLVCRNIRQTYSLPATGGIGTTIFYVIGGLLILAAVAYFIFKRKK
ncbi:MAG: LPXTG cell wall anchor domain-containing protein, partial [Butyrivibrio sp.]|nr:LPXTG cell wall anchor domain-containing protein [Butyrivibrio sp.]